MSSASIIVCTRNRADALARCLASIAADQSGADAEVVVVDNASTDHTPEVLGAAREKSPRPFRVVTTADPGLSRARNAGVENAAGSVFLFTDDDVTVGPGWIDAMVAAFSPGVVAAGGRVVPHVLGKWPAWLEGYDSPASLVDYGLSPFEMSREHLPIGANMAIDAAVLRARLPSPFEPRLGHSGRVALGWDETHLLGELISAGTILYVPNACVEHWVDAERWTYAAVRRSFYQLGVGMGRHKRLAGEALPSFPRRVVRMARIVTEATRLRRRNARMPPASDSAEREFAAMMSAGWHVEMVVGRWHRLSDWLVRAQAAVSGS
jgi:glycosyltransferase involved in cell wall biosynthesis